MTAAPKKPVPPSKATHFVNVEELLARYEREFEDAVANPNAPADIVTGLLSAITALRAEKAHIRP